MLNRQLYWEEPRGITLKTILDLFVYSLEIERKIRSKNDVVKSKDENPGGQGGAAEPFRRSFPHCTQDVSSKGKGLSLLNA